jgi:hypothetical protein
MFKGLGYGIDVVDVLTRLTFLDENTILIKRTIVYTLYQMDSHNNERVVTKRDR